jgi:hypothetical protein
LNDFADIKALAGNDASLLQSLEPAFRKYNEQQYATVKLSGSSEAVWIMCGMAVVIRNLTVFRSL